MATRSLGRWHLKGPDFSVREGSEWEKGDERTNSDSREEEEVFQLHDAQDLGSSLKSSYYIKARLIP